ncbi:MAG: hypothetical protein L6367_14245 [Cellulomonas sp.]|nr:hypothetical protein [Cellulomonas sp.]
MSVPTEVDSVADTYDPPETDSPVSGVAVPAAAPDWEVPVTVTSGDAEAGAAVVVRSGATAKAPTSAAATRDARWLTWLAWRAD